MAPLLADPLRWTWIGFAALAFGVHLHHVHRMRGEQRLWHGGHAFMAAAMGWMLLPAGLGTMAPPLWFIASAGAAGVALVHPLLRHADGARLDLPWITLVVGLAATAYMWLMMAGIAAAPLTYAVAAWLVCETLGWFTGVLTFSPVRPAAPAVCGTTTRPAAPVRLLAGHQSRTVAATAADRLLLGLLGLEMAYLIVAMQQMSMVPMP